MADGGSSDHLSNQLQDELIGVTAGSPITRAPHAFSKGWLAACFTPCLLFIYDGSAPWLTESDTSPALKILQ